MEFNDNRVGLVSHLEGMLADSLTNGYMFNYVRYERSGPPALLTMPAYIASSIDLETQLMQLAKQKTQFAKDVMNIRVYLKMQSKYI